MGRAKGSIGRLAVMLAAGASLAACASVHPEYSTRFPSHGVRVAPGGGGYKIGAPYEVGGVWYVPREQPDYDETGVASWYGEQFNLKPTANGEIFDKDIPSAAHPTLPLPSLVEVTNLDNGRKLIVRVNDRGPYVGGRLIDLSEEAARELGYEKAGLARVRVRYVGRAPLYGSDSVRYAKVEQPRMQLAAAAPPSRRRPSIAPSARQVVHRTASDAAEVVLTSAPATPKPGVMIIQSALPPVAGAGTVVAQLAPLTGKALPDLLPKASAADPLSATANAKTALPKTAPPKAAPPAPKLAGAVSAAPGYQIQVGAFANPDNADRAVSQLASAGHASIIPMSHDGTTLYRVVLDATDEDAAEALREKVAGAGFADARVIHPF